MTVQTWPEELTTFTREDWQKQPQDVRRKRQSDGPPGYRRRLSNPSRSVALSLVVTADQRAVFWRFWGEECGDGVDLFTMPDPSINGWPMLTTDGDIILTGDGLPLLLSEQWLCAWGAETPAEVVIEQVKFKITFTVEVMP